MKKPLILLVDDDRAVLAALEAELAPAFSGIAQIVMFDDPRTAIDSLDEWAVEARLVALVIADLKMPAMGGVELLAEIEQWSETRYAPSASTPEEPVIHAAEPLGPARFTRSIILTGHAGLDAAVSAKNNVGVDRFLEKPWRAEPLLEAAIELFARSLADAKMDRFFTFRLVANAQELLAHWRLRYDVYSGTSTTRHFETSREAPLDLDSFDEFSDLWSVFEHDIVARAETAGTMRLTFLARRSQASIVNEAKAKIGLSRPVTSAPPTGPLPMSQYLRDWPAVAALIARFAEAAERVAEAGRFTLAPALRASRVGTRLAELAIESMVAFAVSLEPLENSLLVCAESHARMYHRYGFKECEGTKAHLEEPFGVSIGCLHHRPEWTPPETQAMVHARAARLRSSGAACQCRSYPACLGGPYETGDFSTVDVLCPLLASKVVQRFTPLSPPPARGAQPAS